MEMLFVVILGNIIAGLLWGIYTAIFKANKYEQKLRDDVLRYKKLENDMLLREIERLIVKYNRTKNESLADPEE